MATMTNKEIIFREQLELMAQGKINSTGKIFKYQDSNGNIIEYMEPEQIHTFQHWKECGFRVKKGQKAIATFPIWKRTVKINDNGEERAKMFLKKSAFFSFSQVEPIEEGK